MSTRTLSIVHKIDGVLTDFDSTPVLRDPTLAYGVKAVVAGTIIVAANTAFTRDGTGLYSYEVTGLTADLDYIAYVERVYLGETKRSSLTWTAGVNDAAGRYADSDDLDDLRGSLNITAWSDLNNTGDRDTNRIQRAFDQTDSDIEKALEHLYTIPLAVTGNDAEILRQWSAVLASHWLYRNRGQYDQPDNANAQAGNLYDAQRKEVMSEISKYRDGQRYRLNAARRNSDNASTPTGPAIIRNPIGPYNPRYLDHEHNR